MPIIKNIINTKPSQKERNCNCIKKEQCPLNHQCLTPCIVYQANLMSEENPRYEANYIGISEVAFKKRYANHKKSFNTERYMNDTALSKEVWRLKKNKETPKIRWKIIKKCSPYKPNSKNCNLCLNEKYEILTFKGNNLLNQKNELISKCRHQNKFLLANFDTND